MAGREASPWAFRFRMDEVWVRFGLVAGALVVAGAATLILRHRATEPLRLLSTTGLAAGTYLFSSDACSTCRSARDKLVARVGEAGFSEFVWESEPRLFAELGIDAVPAVLLVAENGSGTLYRGQPDRALRHV